MKKVEYEERALECLAYEQAADDISIYPASRRTGDKVVKRTEWEDGWNACAMAMTKKVRKIGGYLRSLPEDVTDYILRDVINISADEDTPSMWVNCNDLFHWACADGEGFELKDLPELNQAYQDSPEFGDMLWVCRRRKMRPQQPCYKYLKEDKKLFDACGDQRED